VGQASATNYANMLDTKGIFVGYFVDLRPFGQKSTIEVAANILTMLCTWLLVGVFGLGCSRPIDSVTSAGIWRASNDHGDKPGNGIEIDLNGGQLSGRYYILEPEKSDDFSSGVSFPMTLTKRSSTEFMCDVSFNPAEVDKFVLKLPGKFPDEEFLATTTDTEAGADPSSLSSARSNDVAD